MELRCILHAPAAIPSEKKTPPPLWVPIEAEWPPSGGGGLGSLGEKTYLARAGNRPQSIATPAVQCKTYATVYKVKVM